MWEEQILALHALELHEGPTEVEVADQLSRLLALAPQAPEAWQNPFVADPFCQSQLLCGCPAAFWRRLLKRFPDSTLKQAIARVSEALVEGALGDEGDIGGPPEVDFQAGGLRLRIQESPYHSGGLGRFVYPAAHALSTNIARGLVTVRGKRVLELGCGECVCAQGFRLTPDLVSECD